MHSEIITARQFIKRYFSWRYLGIEEIIKAFFKNRVETSVIDYRPDESLPIKHFVVLNYRTTKHRTRLFVLSAEQLRDPWMFTKYAVLWRSDLKGLYINTYEKIDMFTKAKSFDSGEVLLNMYNGLSDDIFNLIEINDSDDKKEEKKQATDNSALNSILKEGEAK